MVATIKFDSCLCCGSTAISKVFTCKDHTVSNEQFQIWKCNICTFCFTQNIPGLNDIGTYYQSTDYISHSNTKQGFVNKLYHFVRSFTLNTKRDLVVKVTGKEQGNLLDVGAGTGAFVYTMQQAGWKVTGLEPDQVARKNAFDSYRIKLHELSELDSLQEGTFDAITLWHVLEHVHDLHEYLEKFSKLLKPTGKLIVAVPNYTSYDASVYKEFWAAYDVPRHLYHFSPESMQSLMKRHHFTIGEIKPMWFDSFYVSMLSEKYKSGANNYLNAFWVGLVSNFKSLFNSKNCSSVIYIIAKNN